MGDFASAGSEGGLMRASELSGSVTSAMSDSSGAPWWAMCLRGSRRSSWRFEETSAIAAALRLTWRVSE